MLQKYSEYKRKHSRNESKWSFPWNHNENLIHIACQESLHEQCTPSESCRMIWVSNSHHLWLCTSESNSMNSSQPISSFWWDHTDTECKSQCLLYGKIHHSSLSSFNSVQFSTGSHIGVNRVQVWCDLDPYTWAFNSIVALIWCILEPFN